MPNFSFDAKNYERRVSRRFCAPLYLLVILVIIATHVDHVSGDPTSARVVKIIDGDTIHIVLADDTYIVCRLIGIDAPEQSWSNQNGLTKPGQPLARAATDYLTYLLREAIIQVTLHGNDVYNRSLCVIDNSSGSVNGEMVRAGFAEVYHGPGANPYRDQLDAFEQEARTAKRGIWRLQNYESPRSYRRSTAGTEALR